MANLPKPPDPVYVSHERPDDYVEIADKVRTGEYFREARRMFDVSVHDPMSERYMFLFITVLSLLVLMIAVSAMQSLYPLNAQVPLMFYAHDVTEDLPRIKKLQISREDDPSEAMLRFLVEHYVQMREDYEISSFDRNVSGVKSQSTEEVYREFQDYINPRNPEGPINLYQRHSRRYITVLYTKRLPESMEVVFDATVESRSSVKKSRYRANIAFKYSGLELDEKDKSVKPVSFLVTKYHSKRLQESK